MTLPLLKDLEECKNRIDYITTNITQKQDNFLVNIEKKKQNFKSLLISLEQQKQILTKKTTDLDKEIKELLLTKENMKLIHQKQEEELNHVRCKNENISKENAALREILKERMKEKQNLEGLKNGLLQKLTSNECIRREKEIKYNKRVDMLKRTLDCDIITMGKDIIKFVFGSEFFIMDLAQKESLIECYPHKYNLKMYNEKYAELNDLYSFIIWMRKELKK